MNRRIGRVALGAALLLALAACGGGGGGGSGGGSSNNNASGPTVSGIASSGLLGGAQVTIYCGSASGTNLGSAPTDASGSFTITLTGSCSGPILTQAVSTSTTTMLSKLTGSTVTIGSGFQLSRYDAQLPASGSTTLFVTPLSDMVAKLAASLASANGSLDAAVLQQAITVTTTALGVGPDLLQAAPVSASKLAGASLSQQTLYFLGAALEQVAGASANGAQLESQLASLETALSGAVQISGSGSGTTATIQASASAAIVAALESAINALPAAAFPSGVSPAPLLPLTANATIGQVSSAASTGIAAAKNLVISLKDDFLALWTSPASGFLSTKEATVRSDMGTLGSALSGVGRLTKIVEEGEVLALFVANPANAAAVAAQSLVDDSGNTYFTAGNKQQCRVYTNIVNATPLTPYQQAVTVGGVSVQPAVCLWPRTDLPYLIDASGNPGYYFEVVVVSPSSFSPATTGANGSWSSWTSPLYFDGYDLFAVVDPIGTNTSGGPGQSASVTGTFTTSNVSIGATAVSATFALGGTTGGQFATYDGILSNLGYPVPDTATVKIGFNGSATGTTSGSSGFTPTSLTVSGLAGSATTANLAASCAACGLALSGGDLTADLTGGAPTALSGGFTVVATSPNFQFSGTFGVSESTTSASGTTPGTRTFVGNLASSAAFQGSVSAASNGVVAGSPFLTGTVTLDSWVEQQPTIYGGSYVTRSITGGISGTLTAGSKSYDLSVSASDKQSLTQARTVTATMTYVDPANLQVSVSATSTTTSSGVVTTTGTISSGDTTINLSSGHSGTVDSNAAGGQIGTYSDGTFTFTDGSYLVI